jgi:hypothetical protein
LQFLCARVQLLRIVSVNGVAFGSCGCGDVCSSPPLTQAEPKRSEDFKGEVTKEGKCTRHRRVKNKHTEIVPVKETLTPRVFHDVMFVIGHLGKQQNRSAKETVSNRNAIKVRKPKDKCELKVNTRTPAFFLPSFTGTFSRSRPCNRCCVTSRVANPD